MFLFEDPRKTKLQAMQTRPHWNGSHETPATEKLNALCCNLNAHFKI